MSAVRRASGRCARWHWSRAGLLTGITHLPSVHDLALHQAVCALGASALWGGATVAGRRLSPLLPPLLLAGSRFALAVPLLVVFALCSPPGHAASATAQAHGFGFLLLIVLLPDLLGMVLYYRGLRGTPASIATLAELCYPLTALLIGITVLHTAITPAQWLGLILLVAAVLALGRRPDTVSTEMAIGVDYAGTYPRRGRRPLPRGGRVGTDKKSDQARLRFHSLLTLPPWGGVAGRP